MGCAGCSSGRGCATVTNGTPKGCGSSGSCGSGGCNKLNIFDWLANMELPTGQKPFDVIEVRFKNSRKEFFRNVNSLPVLPGEVVAVEGSPGHDIGIISMTGELVKVQMKKKGVQLTSEEIKKLYRKAKQPDIDKWKEAQSLEVTTMYKARTIAVALGLQMKISDVEYQGDKNKATFYYTAEDRVDFRELIKKLAEEFRVRIEMRQIGARQEAARLGGIGSCGRELCCSTWLTDFRTVNTSAARYQQLSLNPLKLAGQCGKLKCCLNYELDSYLDALKSIPESNVKLLTGKGPAFHQKTDIFRGVMWYSYESDPSKFILLTASKVKEILALNKEGKQPEELIDEYQVKVAKEKQSLPDYQNVVGQDEVTRFDKSKQQHKHKHRQPKKKGGGQQHPNQKQAQNKNPNPNPNQNRGNNRRGNNRRNNNPNK